MASFTTKKSHVSHQHYANNIESVLSVLFRKMLTMLNITADKFNYLMLNYLNNPRNRIPGNVKERSIIRGNLRRELLDDRMSWKVFCKSLIFLNVLSIDLVLKITIDGKETTHLVSNYDISKKDGKLLSTFFHQIVNELGISEKDFMILIVEKINKGLIHNSLKKELLKDIMTWKVFCKGLAFLNVTKFIMIVDLIHPNGARTSFDTTVIFSSEESI